MAASVLGSAPGANAESNATAGRTITVQLLPFNDYHGHLEATDKPMAQDPTATPLAVSSTSAKLTQLRAKMGGQRGTRSPRPPVTSSGIDVPPGMFRRRAVHRVDEHPRLGVSSVGNHEFDEGTAELFRMQNGGCHPVDGCYFPASRMPGPRPHLAANVIKNSTGTPPFPGAVVKTVGGEKIGFIGMTLQGDPSPRRSRAGVPSVTFQSEITAWPTGEANKLTKGRGPCDRPAHPRRRVSRPAG